MSEQRPPMPEQRPAIPEQRSTVPEKKSTVPAQKSTVALRPLACHPFNQSVQPQPNQFSFPAPPPPPQPQPQPQRQLLHEKSGRPVSVQPQIARHLGIESSRFDVWWYVMPLNRHEKPPEESLRLLFSNYTRSGYIPQEAKWIACLECMAYVIPPPPMS